MLKTNMPLLVMIVKLCHSKHSPEENFSSAQGLFLYCIQVLPIELQENNLRFDDEDLRTHSKKCYSSNNQPTIINYSLYNSINMCKTSLSLSLQ